MSEQEQRAGKLAEGSSTSSGGLRLEELALVLSRRRRLIGCATGLGMVAALGIAFAIPSEYVSTAQLMPPDQQALLSPSMLSALAGVSAMAPGLSGALTNARTPGGTAIGILNSRTAQDDLINRFDLRRVYYCRLYATARKKLTRRTTIVKDRKSGIITISVRDHDRYRAREMAEAYVEELDKLIATVSTSAARRERQFLETRLNGVKAELDATALKFSEFSSANRTFDVPGQTQTTLAAAARLQGELIAAESQLSGLKALYTDDNIRVRELRARIGELETQLRAMSGAGEDVEAADLKPDQLSPSLRRLPILGLTYFDLYHRLNMQEALYETLARQYELAKVQEAKEIPVIKVLDEPEVAERKSFPPRLLIVALGGLLAFGLSCLWVAAGEVWPTLAPAHPARQAVEILHRLVEIGRGGSNPGGSPGPDGSPAAAQLS